MPREPLCDCVSVLILCFSIGLSYIPSGDLKKVYEATQLEASIATGAPDYLDRAAIDSIIRSKDALYSVLLGHHGNVNSEWHNTANTKRVRRMCMGTRSTFELVPDN